MRTLCTTVLIVGVVVGGATSSFAQSPDPQDHPLLPGESIPVAAGPRRAPVLSVPDAAARQDALEKWVREFSEWKQWNDLWGNRREPGWFSDYRTRRQRPDPPAWLFDQCAQVVEDEGTMIEACRLVAEWSTDFAASQAANARAAAVNDNEEIEKTTFWRHVHLDFGWPAMQSGMSLYGVVGMHATTSIGGRWQIFVAPGAMLLNVPTRDGGRAWKFATNYGMAYRLGEITLPGRRPAILHLNLAKAWLLGTGPEIQTKSTDFIGLSMTFKKRP